MNIQKGANSMNFANNIKAIRKENELSQEQLAEKLGVSRQSVSKWESGQSYPEMDKILLICKMFNYDIGELMNENVKDVSETKQSKTRANKAIEDFFDYITRFVEMFSAMTFKQKVKCIFEQVMNAAILAVLSLIIWLLIDSVVYGVFGSLNYDIYRILSSIIDSVVLIVCVALSFTILLHIFKIRYLDYYEIVKPEIPKEEDEATEETEDNDEAERSTTNRKFLFSKKPEKIIIRDPEHSSTSFLVPVIKAVVLFFKLVLAFVGVYFALSFVVIAALLVISFMFVKTGLLFAGTLLVILAFLAINFVVLRWIYNVIASKKTRKRIAALILIISLLACGIGTGLMFIGFTAFNIVEKPVTMDTDFNVKMTENLDINCYLSPIEYVETDSDEIKITVTHSGYCFVYLEKWENERNIYPYYDSTKSFDLIRAVIRDINRKEINEYYFDNTIDKVVVYTSKENIQKLKENNTQNRSKDKTIDELLSKIEVLKNENAVLRDEIAQKDKIIDEKNTQLVTMYE